MVMGLETYEKEAYTEKHVKVEQNKQKIKVFQVMASRTLEQVCVHTSLACMHRLDHAYVDPYLETLINIETKLKPKTLNLAIYHA